MCCGGGSEPDTLRLVVFAFFRNFIVRVVVVALIAITVASAIKFGPVALFYAALAYIPILFLVTLIAAAVAALGALICSAASERQ